ncbi:hypothetical protein SBDP1_220024 [Syntrophobacter sp. SbD1]|nr:hypothetical protein SBDP1_220024 [Syntrophobacter sp. SbD1]
MSRGSKLRKSSVAVSVAAGSWYKIEMISHEISRLKDRYALGIASATAAA